MGDPSGESRNATIYLKIPKPHWGHEKIGGSHWDQAMILCFCGSQVWGNTQERTMAAHNFITTTTLWDTGKKKSVFFKTLQKSALHNVPLWKKNGHSGFCDSVHVSTRWPTWPSSEVQMMQKPWQNTSKKQFVTQGYTLPYCTLNVSGSLIEWTAGDIFRKSHHRTSRRILWHFPMNHQVPPPLPGV